MKWNQPQPQLCVIFIRKRFPFILPETTLSTIEASLNYLQTFTKESIFQYGMNYEVNFQITSTSKVLRSCSSQVVNERFKKYSMLPNELLTFETTNFKNIKFQGADHSENSWNKRLAIPLLFLFGENQNAK